MCSADRYSFDGPTLPAASSDLQAVAVTSEYEDIYLQRSKWQSIQEELDNFDKEQLPDSEELKRLRKIVRDDDKKERELEHALAHAQQTLVTHQTQTVLVKFQTYRMAMDEGNRFIQGRAELVRRKEALYVAIQEGERDLGKDIINRLRGTEYELELDDSDSDSEHLFPEKT